MDELKHTSGPWDYQFSTTSDCDFVLWSIDVDADDEGRTINKGKQIIKGFITCEPDEWEANSRLIKFAPTMLDALKEIAEDKGAFSRDPLEHCTNCVESMKALAQEAIRKATTP